MVVMAHVKHNTATVKKFPTVTEAYRYYVKHYATFGEWFYYLRVAHKLLNQVTDENIMKCIFTHVFYNGCITEERGVDR